MQTFAQNLKFAKNNREGNGFNQRRNLFILIIFPFWDFAICKYKLND